METFHTKYGIVNILKNDMYIYKSFKNKKYWDEKTLLLLKKYINPNKNILEIGGHCGTSTIIYSSYLNINQNIFVFEPQTNLYNILIQNIIQNNLQHKIKAFNKGVFCYSGTGFMNNLDLDGNFGYVKKRYNEEKHLGCNFAGITLGLKGEKIELTTIDDLNLENIGFIHCDAQGSENFIFSKGLKLIERYRPVILFEDNQNDSIGQYLYNNVCNSYKAYKKESLFRIDTYCIETLNYSESINNFNGGTDTLLIP